MPITNQKRIGKSQQKETVTLSESLHETWRVMKPLVYFSYKAMKVLAHTLIFIVKHIPKPEEHKPATKRDKIIKIS
jgi:hypothetical protein